MTTAGPVALIGGAGFIGQAVIARLARSGVPMRVATRRPARARDLSVFPTVQLCAADPRDAASLQSLLKGCSAVVNLAGILHDPRAPAHGGFGPAFTAAHVELPRALAAACRQAGVRRVVHVGALGAAADAPSAYLRSKAEGERLLREDPGLAVTVLRPSVVFGRGDSFMNLFASLARSLPCILLGGAGARLQPVAVEDVADAVVAALAQEATAGRAYSLCGPAVYTLAELVGLAARLSGHPRPVLGLPRPLAMAMAALFERLPGPTLLSRDNLRSLAVDSIDPQQPHVPAPELGLRHLALEPAAAAWLGATRPRAKA
jgi:NADH dehydrogenase